MIDDTMVDNTMVDDTMIRHGSVHWVLSFLICSSKMIFLSEVLIANSIPVSYTHLTLPTNREV